MRISDWSSDVCSSDLNLRAADADCTAACDRLYSQLQNAGVEVLYDDRDESAGATFASMDLIGLPWQLVVGTRGLENGIVELKRRGGGAGERAALSPDAAVPRLAACALGVVFHALERMR